jgi:hypothetical protein
MCVYTHNGIPFGFKKKEILQNTTWVDLEDIMLSKIRQIQQDKPYMILFI